MTTPKSLLESNPSPSSMHLAIQPHTLAPAQIIFREKARSKNEFDLLTTLHSSEHVNLPLAPLSAHSFIVALEPANFTEEKYLLYEKYQRLIHHESTSEISRSGFKRFLCTSPLPNGTTTNPGSTCPRLFGSYHQTYRLDDTLIAFSVLDLLPHAVSGVYFIYDAAYSKYSLGKLSAMREAALALEGGYEYYYMGFYIHDCVKMKYKGEYNPQFVLDPERYQWNVLDESFKKKLTQQKYVTLSFQQDKDERQSSSSTAAAPQERDKYPTPTSAADSGLSLLECGFVGMTPLPELFSKVNLGETPFVFKQGDEQVLVELQNLVVWEEGDFLDPTSIKGAVAELAACLGTEVAAEMVIDFSR